MCEDLDQSYLNSDYFIQAEYWRCKRFIPSFQILNSWLCAFEQHSSDPIHCVWYLHLFGLQIQLNLR